jgi:alkyl hydroperoxide reductase subunit AhpF
MGDIVDDDRCRTRADGVFAACDVTNVPQKQIIVRLGKLAKALSS